MLLFIAFRTAGQSYSTCTIDPKTCPDGYCDSLEKLDPEGLCPQDCLPKGNSNISYMILWFRIFKLYISIINTYLLLTKL